MSSQDITNSKYPNTFYRVSLKAVIRNDEGKILVVKEYDSTTWSLPGGGMDHGENETETLARELHEEVGYKGDFDAKILKTQPFWLANKRAYLLWVVYEVETTNQNFSVGEYCSEVAFIDVEEFRDSSDRSEMWIYEHLSDSSTKL